MAEVEVGQVAPEFTLPNQAGESVSLSDFRGKPVVLFFYPKDNTPGCTREACGFRDASMSFEELGCQVLGISRDSESSHRRFIDKYSLTMPLLADTQSEVSNLYGVLKEKKMYGRTSIGIERTTVVIDASGRVAKVFPKVKVDGHVDEVLDFVRSFGATQ